MEINVFRTAYYWYGLLRKPIKFELCYNAAHDGKNNRAVEVKMLSIIYWLLMPRHSYVPRHEQHLEESRGLKEFHAIDKYIYIYITINGDVIFVAFDQGNCS